jgi:hypothetical protein
VSNPFLNTPEGAILAIFVLFVTNLNIKNKYKNKPSCRG